jgi:hypothetical protein
MQNGSPMVNIHPYVLPEKNIRKGAGGVHYLIIHFESSPTHSLAKKQSKL